ncbi:MAG: amino acid racemase [Burkholderiaceae bacterium]|nr:amino acid racemase [Burkholderiaceae bacterium]
MLGVIGGMGPAATADFFAKLIEETPASGDEEHIPTLIASDPRLPGRPAAILEGGPSPLPALLAVRDRLLGAGATMLAMPCNTAHYWFDDLVRGCPVPFISIVEASCDALQGIAPPAAPVGLIGTRATLAGGIFDRRLRAAGHPLLLPSEDELAATILPSIRKVKEGQPVEAGGLLAPAVQALLDRGAAAVILACTELPLALDAVGSPLRARCVDSNRALAQACVARWLAR